MPALPAEIGLNDPIAAHMHQDFARLPAGQTVGEALDWLRQNPPGGPVVYFYVVDPDGRLQGVVPARYLILSPPEKPLADVMVRKVIALPADATVLDACEFFIQHRLLAFPVVDAERRVVGVVDVGLYTDELGQLEDADRREDLFQRVGVKAGAREESPLFAFRRRFPWLGCNLAAGILAAFLSGVFEEELTRVVALAYFIPVVLNLAESVSSQSVSLTLQLLHGRTPHWPLLWQKLRAELATGLMLGLAAGAVVALVALVWLGRRRVALALLGGVAGGVTGAALLGVALPFVLRFLHLEPRVAAGPVALAGADIVTILIYLILARWLLG
jgi:magnesium transporter